MRTRFREALGLTAALTASAGAALPPVHPPSALQLQLEAESPSVALGRLPTLTVRLHNDGPAPVAVFHPDTMHKMWGCWNLELTVTRPDGRTFELSPEITFEMVPFPGPEMYRTLAPGADLRIPIALARVPDDRSGQSSRGGADAGPLQPPGGETCPDPGEPGGKNMAPAPAHRAPRPASDANRGFGSGGGSVASDPGGWVALVPVPEILADRLSQGVLKVIFGIRGDTYLISGDGSYLAARDLAATVFCRPGRYRVRAHYRNQCTHELTTNPKAPIVEDPGAISVTLEAETTVDVLPTRSP